MPYLIKYFLIPLICLTMASMTLVQNTTAEEDLTVASEETAIEPEDLGVESPTILPNSPWYFLKDWGRSIRLFFTFGHLNKLELEEQFSSEMLMELEKLNEGNADSEILTEAIEKYQKSLEKIKIRAEEVEENEEDDEKIEKFLEKFTKHQLLHYEILEKLENQVPEETFEKIKQAKENHLETFGQVMVKLEEKTEEEPEKTSQKNKILKNLKNLEILNKVEQEFSKEAKELIQEIKEKTIGRLNRQIERIYSIGEKRFQKRFDEVFGEEDKESNVCIDLWDPVCGADNQTYSNTCFVNLAGKEIAYLGECGEKEQCQKDSDCPALLNPTRACLSSEKCTVYRSGCSNNKCIIIEEIQ